MKEFTIIIDAISGGQEVIDIWVDPKAEDALRRLYNVGCGAANKHKIYEIIPR